TLVVFVEKSVDGDIVAVDDQAVTGGIDVPRRTLPVVGAPDPELVAHDVTAVDHESHVIAAWDRSAGAHRQVVEEARICRVVRSTSLWADLDEAVRRHRPGVDNQSGDRHPVDVCHGDGWLTVRRDK